jgi:hypothetical protein
MEVTIENMYLNSYIYKIIIYDSKAIALMGA